MTRLISIKAASDLPSEFKDKIELQIVDNAIEAVVFKINDQSIRIVGTDNYSKTVKILTAQPKKEVTKYRLVGKVADLDVQPQTYDTEREAEEAKRKYDSKFDYDTNLTIESVVEFVDEDKIS
jgi:uncharacterized FAD-dependent dehydrogenase